MGCNWRGVCQLSRREVRFQHRDVLLAFSSSGKERGSFTLRVSSSKAQVRTTKGGEGKYRLHSALKMQLGVGKVRHY